MICKGAVEEVFAACTYYAVDGDVAPLDASHLDQMQEQTARLTADGFRVIAVAYKDIPDPRPAYHTADERGLILLGYVAFLDPPKESARTAIAALARSGDRVKNSHGRQRYHLLQDLPRGWGSDRRCPSRW